MRTGWGRTTLQMKGTSFMSRENNGLGADNWEAQDKQRKKLKHEMMKREREPTFGLLTDDSPRTGGAKGNSLKNRNKCSILPTTLPSNRILIRSVDSTFLETFGYENFDHESQETFIRSPPFGDVSQKNEAKNRFLKLDGIRKSSHSFDGRRRRS